MSSKSGGKEYSSDAVAQRRRIIQNKLKNVRDLKTFNLTFSDWFKIKMPCYLCDCYTLRNPASIIDHAFGFRHFEKMRSNGSTCFWRDLDVFEAELDKCNILEDDVPKPVDVSELRKIITHWFEWREMPYYDHGKYRSSCERFDQRSRERNRSSDSKNSTYWNTSRERNRSPDSKRSRDWNRSPDSKRSSHQHNSRDSNTSPETSRSCHLANSRDYNMSPDSKRSQDCDKFLMSNTSNCHQECPRRFSFLARPTTPPTISTSSIHSTPQSAHANSEQPISTPSDNSLSELGNEAGEISGLSHDKDVIDKEPFKRTLLAELRTKAAIARSVKDRDIDFYRDVNNQLQNTVAEYKEQVTTNKNDFEEARAEWQSQMNELRRKHEQELAEKEASLERLQTISSNTINIKREILTEQAEPLNEVFTENFSNDQRGPNRFTGRNILTTLNKRNATLKRRLDMTTLELEIERAKPVVYDLVERLQHEELKGYENHFSILSQEIADLKAIKTKRVIECEQLKNDKREMSERNDSLRSNYISQNSKILQLSIEKNKVTREKEEGVLKIQELTEELANLKKLCGYFNKTLEGCRSQLTSSVEMIKFMESNAKEFMSTLSDH